MTSVCRYFHPLLIFQPSRETKPPLNDCCNLVRKKSFRIREKETKKESLRFGLKRNENKADKKMASK